MNLPQRTTVFAAIRSRFLAIPSWVLVVEIFIGAGWLRAFAAKAISLDWWRGDTLAAFLIETDDARVPWFHLVTDVIVSPNLVLISSVVMVAQLGIGLALVAGRFRVPALLAGMALNVTFVLAGAVTPSAFYLLAQLVVLLWVIETRRSAWTGALATVLSLSGIALAGSAVLSISSLHPDHVIDDPSMMLVFVGGLTALAAERARMARHDDPIEVESTDRTGELIELR